MSSQKHDITHWKRRFLEYLEIEKGRSLKTIEMYDRYIDRYLAHAGVQLPSDITADNVREFRLYLNREKTRTGTVKKVTQNKYLISIRSFLKYLEKNDVDTLAAAKIELAKAPERELDVITRKEFEDLLSAPNKQKNGSGFERARDTAILELLYSTGLRVSELCSLNNDLDLARDEFTIRGKGEKLRLVFLSESARAAIRDYQQTLPTMNFKVLESGLFVMKSGVRIHPRAIQRMIEKYRIQAGIMRPVTPHDIRHYFATDLLQNGADIRSVQMLLGPVSINTTQVYTKLSDKYLREVHSKFHAK